MKKLFVLILLTSLFYSAQAQDSKIRVGLHFSPSISYFRTDSKITDKSSKVKFSWGFRSEKKFEDKPYSIMLGIDHSKRGAIMRFKGDDEKEYSIDYNYENIEIPVAIKMSTRQIGMFAYWVYVGMAPSFQISENSSMTEKTQNEPLEEFADHSFVDGFDISLILGGGVEYELTEETLLTLGLTFNNGLSNTVSDQKYWKNGKGGFNYFGLQLGVMFR
ncbi:MAG: PorT family protein [Flavobacteriales bacterium]|jgi:hypothetical protein|nr:PorT family protein [Flavobacteriales bacterium]